jgi:uncharacterized protein (DUF1800 family)
MLHPEIAVLRFGLGGRPGELAAASSDPRGWLKSQITGAVPLVGEATLSSSAQIFTALLAAREERRELRQDGTEAAQIQKAAARLRETYQPHYRAQVLARAQSAAQTTRPFAERLVHFWSNHFAVSADKGAIFGVAGTLENEAIRPNVNGRFVDLLSAAVRHPAMIAFLDNQLSIGTDSPAARLMAFRAPKRAFGINENLAREILELHTVGVNGGYTQKDVTTFAQILTGWSIGGGRGRFAGGDPGRFFFRANLHEPGPKVFLGKTYAEDGEAQGIAVLTDLARHPATAHFIAAKLTRHFIADDPPPAVVEHLAQVFLASGGDMPQVYRALIESPEAWDAQLRKFKTPEDFVFSSLRALNVVPRRPEEVIKSFELLGQRQYTPASPAGWPDTAKSWDGADALMHRILWAARLAERTGTDVAPLEVAAAALGGFARQETQAALRHASSGTQALALLLMSPEFQWR